MQLKTYFETTEWHNWFNTGLIALVATFVAPAGSLIEGVLLALAVFVFGGAAVAYRARPGVDAEEVVDRG